MKHLSRIFVALSFAILLICLSLPALSRQLRGDWESSGHPTKPHEPSFEYAYSCQVEITDKKAYEYNGRSSQVYAVAEFELSHKNSSVRADEMTWKLMRFTDDEETGSEVLNSPIPFSVFGTVAALGTRMNEEDKEEMVLRLYSYMQFKNSTTTEEYVGDSGQTIAEKNEQEISARVKIESYDKDFNIVKELSSTVFCEKK